MDHLRVKAKMYKCKERDGRLKEQYIDEINVSDIK